MKRIIPSLALCCLVSSISLGQVASPSLIPGTEILNPALASLKKNSYLSVRYSNLNKQSVKYEDNNSTGPEIEVKKNTISAFEGEYVIYGFGANAYYQSQDTLTEAENSSEAKVTDKTTNINLAYLFYEMVSFGIKKGSSEAITEISPVGTSTIQESKTEDKRSITGYGISFRLFDFFAGFSQDKNEITLKSNNAEEDEKMDTNHLGFGYSHGSPREFEFRVEASQSKSDGIKGSLNKKEDQVNSLELTYQGFIIGLSNRTGKEENLEDDTKIETTETNIHLGWRPLSGFHILLGITDAKKEETDLITEQQLAHLTLGYTF